MLRVSLQVSVEGGSSYAITLERTKPVATLTVVANNQCKQEELPSAEIEDLLNALRECRVTILPESSFNGLANGYRLEIELDSAQNTYQWSHHLPSRWEPLGEIVNHLQSLACRVSGFYINS